MFPHTPSASNVSHVWRSILQDKEVILASIQIKIRSGREALFWKDRWSSHMELCERFHRLYRILSDTCVVVAQVFDVELPMGAGLLIQKKFGEEEIAQLAVLNLLWGQQTSDFKPDTWIRRGKNNSKYQVKSAYNLIRNVDIYSLLQI